MSKTSRGAIGSSKYRREVKKNLGKRHKFCHYCQIRLTDENTTVDHYIPLAMGGSNGKLNLVLCCTDCNQEKGSKMPYEFTPKTMRERSRIKMGFAPPELVELIGDNIDDLF